MDTDLLKTFLEVNRTRHFGQAAENLFLTQSAISSRIRLLEQIVGIPLFSRARGDIQLTPAGNKLVPHAERILNSWTQAKQEISIEDEAITPIIVGSVPNIWGTVLQDWLHRTYKKVEGISITTEISTAETLIRKVTNGALDLAFLFSSPQVSELMCQEIGDVTLVLVSTDNKATVESATRERYVKVDWGTPFDVAHAREFPDIPPPIASMAVGQYAHDFILNCGGSAYLAEPAVATDIEAGTLYKVPGAPVMNRTAYAVYASRSTNRKLIEKAVAQFQIS